MLDFQKASLENGVRMPEKILVVDDDLETLRLVSLMLQRQGYQILSAPMARRL